MIVAAATQDMAGFTVAGYLTGKAADIGMGKVWAKLKKRIEKNPDSAEIRLYEAIEKSVAEYLCQRENYVGRESIIFIHSEG